MFRPDFCHTFCDSRILLPTNERSVHGFRSTVTQARCTRIGIDKADPRSSYHHQSFRLTSPGSCCLTQIGETVTFQHPTCNPGTLYSESANWSTIDVCWPPGRCTALAADMLAYHRTKPGRTRSQRDCTRGLFQQEHIFEGTRRRASTRLFETLTPAATARQRFVFANSKQNHGLFFHNSVLMMRHTIPGWVIQGTS
jgi:hypothetical protein